MKDDDHVTDMLPVDVLSQAKLDGPEHGALEAAGEAVNAHTSTCVRCNPPHSSQQDPRGPCDTGKSLLAAAEEARRAFGRRFVATRNRILFGR